MTASAPWSRFHFPSMGPAFALDMPELPSSRRPASNITFSGSAAPRSGSGKSNFGASAPVALATELFSSGEGDCGGHREALLGSCSDDATGMLRALLGASFKDCPHRASAAALALLERRSAFADAFSNS